MKQTLAGGLKPLRMALVEIADVLAAGADSHPGDPWTGYPAQFHIAKARGHLDALAAGDTSDSHLQNAACRLLMAMSLR
jgi:hypothetical protein